MNAIAAPYPQTSGDRETQLRVRIMQLEKERDALADELTAVKSAFGLTPDLGLLALRLPQCEESILCLLMKREMATHEQLRFALYPNDADARAERDPRITHVLTCRLRKKLARMGVYIEGIWGKGYRLSEAGKARLREAIEAAR